MVLTIAAAILCATVIAWYLFAFNGLVAARNAVDQSWSHIEVELKRRFDLIDNLVEVVKGYAKHESETFQAVTALRSQSQSTASAAAANAVEPEVHRSVGRLMAIAESYPQLLADKSFLNLQHELSDTENRIAERRHAYNETVNLYQNRILSFPLNLVAALHQFESRAYFDAPDEVVAQAPAVKLT
jgi:LemA protein